MLCDMQLTAHRRTVACLAVGFFISGCSDASSTPRSAGAGSTDAASAGAAQRAASPAPTTAASAGSPSLEVSTPSPGSAAAALHGTTYVYLTAADVGRRTVTVDVVQWFTGAAASAACKEDGKPSSESEICNDYYIRNVNPALRTLPVVPGAPVTMTNVGDSGASSAPASLAAVAAALPMHRLYRMDVKAGDVTRIDEVYIP